MASQKARPLTTSRLLRLRSTLITFSLTLMSADAWRRTPTNTSLSSFNSLVMSRLVRRPTRSSSISIILARSLVWVVQPDANVDYCSSLECGTVLNRVLGAQPFNYTDAVDALPNAHHAFGGPAALTGADGATECGGTFSANAFIDRMVYSRMLLPMMQSFRTPGIINTLIPTSPLHMIRVSRMPALSSSLRPPLTCIAGVRIPLSRLSYSSMVRTASRSVKVATSTLSSHTSTTLARPTLVSMSIPSL